MFKRYELHNHTDQSDARITCAQLLEHMVKDNVDCFAITDHNTISGHRIIRELIEKTHAPIQCAYGMEYTTYYGHIVCPVLEEYVPWDSIDRRRPEKLFAACKEKGAVTGVAHPFSYGDPFARGCRFEMDIRDFGPVDYIEIVNNSQPMAPLNQMAIDWWEELVLKGERLAACAGMDLHNLTDMSMKYATYARGQAGGDAVEELKWAIARQETWVSRGMLAVWEKENGKVVFRLEDMRKPGFVYPDRYILTLRGKGGVKEYDISAGALSIEEAELEDIVIPKLYAGTAEPGSLICAAPAIRRG